MELTAEQETDVQKIMAATDCPKGFPCYESGFKDLYPVKTFFGTDIIACLAETASDCSKSFKFGEDAILCECPLRRYVSLNLDR